MNTQTDTQGMDIAAIVAAFSDYDSRVVRIGVVALESTVEYYEDNLWPALDALRQDDDKDVVKVSVLNDRAKGLARKAKIRWDMTEEKLADVVRVRANHTAGRLATYEAWATTESTRKGAKRTAAITMPNYAKFLREIAKGDRDEDGNLTKQGKDAAAKRESEAAALATAVIPMSGVDWDRDMASMTPAMRLETFLTWQANIAVKVAELKAELGDDATAVVAKVSEAKRKAAGLVK
jgi:hypothetical protein